MLGRDLGDGLRMVLIFWDWVSGEGIRYSGLNELMHADGGREVRPGPLRIFVPCPSRSDDDC